MIHILDNKETQKILEKLNKQFGISKIPGFLIKIGQERIFLYQGNINEKEILNLAETIPVERIGIYFAKVQGDEIRLSIEGAQILKDSITKNVFELDEKQTEEWMMGKELNVSSGKKGFIIMKHKNDFLGTGKASELKITNFIPKNRRLKERG